MTITELAIRRSRVTMVGIGLLLMAGVFAYFELPRAEDPGFTVRTAVVTTTFPGASPTRVEELVTEKIESAIQSMPELDSVISTSRTGLSQINVNLKPEFDDLRPIWDDLRRKVEQVAVELPDGVSGPHVNDEFGDVFPIMLSILSEDASHAELSEIAEEVRDQLLLIDEVGKVEIYGQQDERIFVEYRNSRLAEAGLSPSQLRSVLESRNIIIPGGSVVLGDEDIALEPSGNFESLEDLARTIVPLPGSSEVVYLQDLAEIRRDYVDPPKALMRANGSRSLGLSISIVEGGNVIAVGESVRALTDDLWAQHQVGVDFDLSIFQPELVDQKVNDFVVNLLQAIAIVMVVMMVTLGLRTGLVVVSLIPSTMLVTLLLMNLLGVGLDQISIAALIIALGMLVDNAIVMSESITVMMEAGKSRFDAAVDSARELLVPLLTSSLTTAAAFLPIYLAENSIGEYTASLFKVVSLALLSSWALALTMMPSLCMLFLRVKPGGSEPTSGGRFASGYRTTLILALRNRWSFLACVVALFFIAVGCLQFVPKLFVPDSDSPRLLIDVDLPLGTNIRRTERLAASLDQLLQDEFRVNESRERGIVNWSTYVGSGGGPRYRLGYDPATEGAGHVSIIATGTDRESILPLMTAVDEFVTWSWPDAVFTIEPEANGGAGGKPIGIRVSGDDMEQLFLIVDSVRERLATVPGVRNVADDWGPRTKKLVVDVDQARARRAGVSSQDVAVSLQSGLSGITVTEFREGDSIIPIVLRSAAGDRQDIGKLESLAIQAQATGEAVALKQVADVQMQWEASRILRRDRRRTVTVEADLAQGANASAVFAEMEPWLAEAARGWPRGYSHELGGEAESSSDANAAIGAKLPIAGMIILLLLVVQFNSLRRTAIVILTIPLGMIGVTAGLLITGQTFSFFTLLGVISLAGIIINNAIVLLDRIRLEIEDKGLDPSEAIVTAAEQRLRPILLTTATTIGGLLPLWLFGGPLWESMAVAIMSGLAFATLLTLGVVPALYSLFFRVSVRDLSA